MVEDTRNQLEMDALLGGAPNETFSFQPAPMDAAQMAKQLDQMNDM